MSNVAVEAKEYTFEVLLPKFTPEGYGRYAVMVVNKEDEEDCFLFPEGVTRREIDKYVEEQCGKLICPLTRPERLLLEWKQYPRATNFSAQLFNLIAKADVDNRQKLAKAFPSEVTIYIKYSQDDDFWPRLLIKARLCGWAL